MRAFLLFLIMLMAVPGSLRAAGAVQELGRFDGWQAYRSRLADGQDVCFMQLKPQKSGWRATKGDAPRNAALLSVTLRPTENINPVISFESGYAFRKGSETEVVIGKSCYRLFTDHGTAWARTSSLDKDVTEAMLHAKTMVVTGISEKGSRSADLFNLKGADKALKSIAKACGLVLATN